MSSTNRGAKRSDRDSYETPSWVTEMLIPEIVWPMRPSILEPCCGDGAIVKVFDEYIPDATVVGFDLVTGIDFLTWKPTRRFDFIITNPPFSLAEEFIDKSLKIANCVIMLLPLGFFGSIERHDWWLSHKSTAQHTLSRRPMFGKNKYGKWGTDSETYAWFVWDKAGRQATGFNWLRPDEKMYRTSVKAFKERYEANLLALSENASTVFTQP